MIRKTDYTIYDCSLVELLKNDDLKGNLTVVQSLKNVPFDIKRVFYLYDIPGGESRGAHAHKHCHQFLVAASGSFEVMLDDGVNRRTVLLNRPFYGLHIPPGIWAAEQGFSSGSVCLVLTSKKYDEADYIRNYADYKQYKEIINAEMTQLQPTSLEVSGGGKWLIISVVCEPNFAERRAA